MKTEVEKIIKKKRKKIIYDKTNNKKLKLSISVSVSVVPSKKILAAIS